jgi:hypothetical protein
LPPRDESVVNKLLDDIIKKGTEITEAVPSDFQQSEIAARSQKIEEDGKEQFFQLRKIWSYWLIGWITASLLFQWFATGLIGLGFLDFTQYKWLATAIFGENFIQIVGMGYLIIKFLYPSSGSPAKKA